MPIQPKFSSSNQKVFSSIDPVFSNLGNFSKTLSIKIVLQIQRALMPSIFLTLFSFFFVFEKTNPFFFFSVLAFIALLQLSVRYVSKLHRMNRVLRKTLKFFKLSHRSNRLAKIFF